jgi:DNA-directed RNA polymerase I, II, and III subunit RPABC1
MRQRQWTVCSRSRLNFSCQPGEEMLLKYTPAPSKKDPNPQPAIGII